MCPNIVHKRRSIYRYSNVAPSLSGETSIFGAVFFVSKSLWGIERQTKLNNFKILTRKSGSHVRILRYRTWPIEGTGYEARETLKKQTKLTRCMLEGPRPCTILFCAHTLCVSYTTSTFLLVSSSVRSELSCFVHGQGQLFPSINDGPNIT